MAQQDTQAAGSGQTIKTHPLLDLARDLVITDQKASISYVQRKLKVGYNDAATLLDTLELEGVVSQLGPDFTRTVLATKTAGNGCNAPVMAQQLKSPPAPVSKTVQRLLAQIHAEAEAATLAALSAKDGIVTLQDADSATRSADIRGDSIVITDRAGYTLMLWRRRVRPDCWEDTGINWHPSFWYSAETRVDGAGRKWQTYDAPTYVTDDFGTLVNVEGGAA